MSRSYKKTPICKSKEYWVTKRDAAKKVRNTEDIPNGAAYKRVVEQYDLNDIISYWPKRDAIAAWNGEGEDGWRHRRYKTLDNYLNKCWAKYNFRK